MLFVQGRKKVMQKFEKLSVGKDIDISLTQGLKLETLGTFYSYY